MKMLALVGNDQLFGWDESAQAPKMIPVFLRHQKTLFLGHLSAETVPSSTVISSRDDPIFLAVR